MVRKLKHHTTLFLFIMWARIFYGTLRVFLGLTLLKFVGVSFTTLFMLLMSHELIEDRGDLLYKIFSPLAFSLHYNVTYFIAIYFIFWGAIDIFLSSELLQNRLWAYPATFVLICCFMIYEFFRVLHTHSLILWLIIFYDLLALWFIRREYLKLKHHELSVE